MYPYSNFDLTLELYNGKKVEDLYVICRIWGIKENLRREIQNTEIDDCIF